VLNGPQLHVWLTSANPVADTVGVLLPDYVDLGPLKGNIGDQNYPIPDDLDLSIFNSVVIWCVPFRVAFNAAPLVRP
ncbi:MAG: DM13 domain-containing protein, partial [Chloroflexi bacterium]|nr:DM13 domain-containing protein [Chloroflexota bacterium]